MAIADLCGRFVEQCLIWSLQIFVDAVVHNNPDCPSILVFNNPGRM